LTPYDFSVSRHYDAILVIEAESKAVQNILIEHDFQDAGNRSYEQKETTSRVMVASKPKVSSNSPGESNNDLVLLFVDVYFNLGLHASPTCQFIFNAAQDSLTGGKAAEA
jgi:hypothetical protein